LLKKVYVLLLMIILIQVQGSLFIYGEEKDNIIPEMGFEYQFTDTLQIEESLYKVGYRRNIENNDVDGLIVKYDKTATKIEMTYIYDIGYTERFTMIGIFSNGTFGVVCRSMDYNNIYHNYYFNRMELLQFDNDGFYLGKTMFQTDYLNYGNCNYEFLFIDEDKSITIVNELLEVSSKTDLIYTYSDIFSYQFLGDAWINYSRVDELFIDWPGNYHIEISNTHFNYEFDIILNPIIEGVADGFQTNSEVMIISKGELFLNGIIYQSNSSILEPGNYHLEIKGDNWYSQDLFFTIIPLIDGIVDNEESKEPVKITSNASSMTLNDEIYSGEVIGIPNHYQISFYGVGDYKGTLTFTILPSIKGVENDCIYTSPVEIAVSGEAYINGVPLDRNYTVSKSGEYQIVIMFDGEVYQELFFEVTIEDDFVLEESVSSNKINMYQIVLGGLILLGLFLIIRKK